MITTIGFDADDTLWHNETVFVVTYTADDFSGKETCKAALQEQLGLEVDPSIPLFGVVSRFATQKGLDLLAECLPKVLEGMKVQFAVLGSGDGELETLYRNPAARFKGRLGLHVGFNGQLAKLLIQAGSDFFVMPSRAEPCGLTQLYAMLYGTPPIVRATDGLIDTVDQYVEATGKGTGFKFEDTTALANTIGWACSTYYDKPEEYRQLRLNGMAKDFSWRGIRQGLRRRLPLGHRRPPRRRRRKRLIYRITQPYRFIDTAVSIRSDSLPSAWSAVGG